MAKGDYVKVRTEIGGKLETDEIRVTGAGGNVEVEFPKNSPFLEVSITGRTGKVKQAFRYALSAVRSVEEFHRDAD